MRNHFFYILLFLFATSCGGPEEADLIIFNAKIYTIDSAFSVKEALVIKGGKIEAVSTTNEILEKYTSKNKIDAEGKTIYPGFIDAHAHFYNYGLSLKRADLTGTVSWADILIKLQAFASENKEGWLIGRGWDQNDWTCLLYTSDAADE